MTYYGSGQELEHDFVVSPQADPRLIRMRYSDGATPRVDSDGSLLLDAGLGPNSQCRISGPLTLPATSAGTDLTIHPHFTLQGGLAAGPQKVYFLVTDLAQRNTGWMQGSTWTP